MKAALVGSSGYIAQHISRKFDNMPQIEDTLKIGRATSAPLELSAPGKFDYNLLYDVDYIIFTAAISSPDQCAKEFDASWNVNVTGSVRFIREALSRNCHVLFFSSDAVFGDIPGAIYDEESETAPCTPYGKMKKAVEDEFQGEKNFKSIRLSYVASAKDRFIAYCLNCMRRGEVADIFHPFYRNVTVISDVADVTAYFALHWNEYSATFLNVAGRELISRIRIADELNRLFGGKLKYKISAPDDAFFMNRPKITQMNSLYLRGIVRDATFTEKLRKELEGIEL